MAFIPITLKCLYQKLNYALQTKYRNKHYVRKSFPVTHFSNFTLNVIFATFLDWLNR